MPWLNLSICFRLLCSKAKGWCQVDASKIDKELKSRLDRMATVTGGSVKVVAGPRLVKIFSAAEQEAAQMGDAYISTEHFLLALIKVDTDLGGALKKMGVKEDKILGALREMRGSQKVTDDDPENKYEVLKKYARDLSAVTRKSVV
jgi:ATP-dependent Clp protease ATP-binding subunit ClpB